MSLLSHHSPITRRESLAYLITHYPITASPPPTAKLIPALSPLILDTSSAVRTELLKLFKLLPENEMELHLSRVLLHVHSAMTHLDPGVRGDSTRFLQWALDTGPDEVFARGGWSRGLKALSGVLSFRGAAMTSIVTVPGAESKKTVLQHLDALRMFLEKGLNSGDSNSDEQREEDSTSWAVRGGLHWSWTLNALPQKSSVYAYLGLFETSAGSADAEPTDQEGRGRWRTAQGKGVVESLRAGLTGLMREGGEAGRAASRVLGVLERHID